MKKKGMILGIACLFLLIGYGIIRMGIYVVQYPPAPRIKQKKIQVACVGDSITYGAKMLKLINSLEIADESTDES